MDSECEAGETLYTSEKHWFVVRRIEGRLVIQVVCGMSGLTMQSRELRESEVELFNENPERLAVVAREICEEWAAGTSQEA